MYQQSNMFCYAQSPLAVPVKRNGPPNGNFRDKLFGLVRGARSHVSLDQLSHMVEKIEICNPHFWVSF